MLDHVIKKGGKHLLSLLLWIYILFTQNIRSSSLKNKYIQSGVTSYMKIKKNYLKLN